MLELLEVSGQFQAAFSDDPAAPGSVLDKARALRDARAFVSKFVSPGEPGQTLEQALKSLSIKDFFSVFQSVQTAAAPEADPVPLASAGI